MKSSIALSFLAFAQYALANERSGPAVTPQDTSPLGARALLEKRETCEGGGRCLVGQCCGIDGCAMNCCGVDMSGEGVGCNIGASCDYANESVFIGCCNDLLGRGCTGTPTMVTMSTIYGDYTPTNDATTSTREPTFTSTSDDEPTESETPTLPTATQTSLPTITLSGSDDEDPFETATDDDTTTTRPTSSSDDDFPFPSETTTAEDFNLDDILATLTADSPEPTESGDAAAALDPSLWFAGGLGALIAFL
ncbi:hypothetical protein BJX66DRAFT_298089 [Aspergillus keveii]|uniref:GPI anchored protein n=1 Tax=Aspergillus keveii TaxID=714993 RepID=A0ABR4GE36_9EURO